MLPGVTWHSIQLSTSPSGLGCLRWGSWAVCDPGSGIVGGGMRAGMARKAEALTEGRWPCQREVRGHLEEKNMLQEI